MPLKIDNVLSDKRMKLLNLYITYVNKKTYQEDRLDVIDNLVEAFDGIDINTKTISRYLPIIDREVTYGDSITLKLTFKYLDDRREPYKDNPDASYTELMEILKLNVEDINDIKNKDDENKL